MYQIVKGATTVGYAESLTYVAKMDNGDFGLSSEADAVGISFDGAVYGLEDRDYEAAGLEPVKLVVVDGGALLNRQAAQLRAANEEIALTQNAMCEQDAATDARLSDIELALCELDERTTNN